MKVQKTQTKIKMTRKQKCKKADNCKNKKGITEAGSVVALLCLR
jgi:hypothetical protein